MDWLPDAVRNPHGRALTFTTTHHPKGLLHTTEAAGWPVYAGWTINPHATVMPVPGHGVEVRQHTPFSSASFSLKNNAGGVETNRDYVFQFELIGTSTHAGPGYYWPDADDAVLLDLYKKVIHPLSVAFSIPEVSQPWQAYPASFGARGNTNHVRLSGPEWNAYSGWLGHQHAPENVHGDPGAFPWERMMALAGSTPAPPPTPGDDMPISNADADLIAARLLAYQITLSSSAAQAMSLAGETQRAPGDKVSTSYIDQWGGPGLFKLLGEVRALKAQNLALSAAVSAIAAAVAATTPEGTTQAFADGIAALKAELSALDVHIVVDDTPST